MLLLLELLECGHLRGGEHRLGLVEGGCRDRRRGIAPAPRCVATEQSEHAGTRSHGEAAASERTADHCTESTEIRHAPGPAAGRGSVDTEADDRAIDPRLRGSARSVGGTAWCGHRGIGGEDLDELIGLDRSERRIGRAETLLELVHDITLGDRLFVGLQLIEAALADHGFDATRDVVAGDLHELLDGVTIRAGVDPLVASCGHDVLHGCLAIGQDSLEFFGLFRSEIKALEKCGVAGLDGVFLLAAHDRLDLGSRHELAEGFGLLQGIVGDWATAGPALADGIAALSAALARGDRAFFAAGTLGRQLVAQLFVEALEVPRAFLQVSAFVWVHGRGTQRYEFAVLLPGEHGTADGGEGEKRDQVGFGGLHRRFAADS